MTTFRQTDWGTSCQNFHVVSYVHVTSAFYRHRRSQDFVWGLHFGDLFLVVALTDRLNIPPNLSHSAKTVLKWLLLWLGVHFVSWEGALAHFSCKLGMKFFFTALGGAGAPTASPGYAYVLIKPMCLCIYKCYFSSANRLIFQHCLSK